MVKKYKKHKKPKLVYKNSKGEFIEPPIDNSSIFDNYILDLKLTQMTLEKVKKFFKDN